MGTVALESFDDLWQSFSIIASKKDVARKSEYANSPIAPMAPTHSLIIPHMVGVV